MHEKISLLAHNLGIFKTGKTFPEAVRNSMTHCGAGYTAEIQY